MTCTQEGFNAWGKDMGGYTSNPTVATANEELHHHSTGGYVDGVNTYPAKNDRGYDWWVGEGKGELVLEDPAYCAKVAYTVGSWIELLTKYKG